MASEVDENANEPAASPRKLPLKLIAAFVGLVFMAAIAVSYFAGWFRFLIEPVLVAVIDTGVDPQNPLLVSRLVKTGGINIVNPNADTRDLGGHGTRVALEIVRACWRCQILPIKISEAGLAITPEFISRAIDHAVASGANILNFSFGVNQTSPELQKSIENATQKGVVLVAAAGGGVPNPFRPVELTQIYPQAFPQVINVGSAKSLDEPDLMMNFGDLLDVVVTGQDEDQFGSSFGAARVSGYVAELMTSKPNISPVAIRQRLRATATPPKMKPGLGLDAVLARFGFGAFDSAAFLAVDPNRISVKYFSDDSGKLWAEVSSEVDVVQASGEVKCSGRGKAAPGSVHPDIRVFPKARVRVSVLKSEIEGVDSRCSLRLKLSHPDGSSRMAELSFRE